MFFPKNIDDHDDDDDDDDPTDQKAKEMFVFEIRHMRRALSANIFHARESRDKGGGDDGDKCGHDDSDGEKDDAHRDDHYNDDYYDCDYCDNYDYDEI